MGIAFFGPSQTMVLAVIAFGGLWPMPLAMSHGFATLDPHLREVGRVLGFGRLAMTRCFALPDILAGMRLGLTVALILSVVGEMLARQPGLGVLLAARAFPAPALFASVVLLGTIGLTTNAALAGVEGRALRWGAPWDRGERSKLRHPRSSSARGRYPVVSAAPNPAISQGKRDLKQQDLILRSSPMYVLIITL